MREVRISTVRGAWIEVLREWQRLSAGHVRLKLAVGDPLVGVNIDSPDDRNHLRLGSVEAIHPAKLEDRSVRKEALAVGVHRIEGSSDVPVEALMQLVS